ncbi:hypothetical protein AB2J22_13550 [Aeromonas sp. A5]|uniref:hypothetical protein n=1 Tax=unclassified Aeromonas TaxID=257493 RepID=UPI00376F6193
MALDRNGTGTSQGSSSNQKGGSGEGSRNQGSGAGNRGSSASKNSSNSSSSGKGASQSGGGKSSPGQSKASSDTGGKKSNSASQSSGSSVKSGGSLAGNTGLASGTSASESESGTKKGVAGRVSSVNQALSSYGAAPSYARAGYGDSLNSQRQQAEVSKHGSNNSISSIGGPSMYGMGKESYDKSIGTDNFNGVLGNIQQKAQRGTASEADRASLASATSDYNNLRGAGVIGNTLAGTPGQWGVQQLASAAMGAPGDYLSGAARKAATGGLDDSRLAGQRDKIGDGGMADSAVKGGASLLGAAVPGAGLLASGISSSLTVGAPGLGALLNSINEQLGNTVNSSANNSNGSGKDYVAPPRQSLTGAQQGEGTLAFDSNYYDPSRFNVTAGRRGY